MPTQTIQLGGLTCPACVKLTQRRLQQIPEIQAVTVESNGVARCTAGRTLSVDEIQQSLEGTPYRVVGVTEAR